MKRMPFKMIPSRTAQSRRTYVDMRGKEVTTQHSGRAHFIWYQYVLIPLACGSSPTVEIRDCRGNRNYGPWHSIDYTPDEALALIMEHYPLQRVNARKIIMSHRKRKGMK